MAYENNQAPKDFDKQSASFRKGWPTMDLWVNHLKRGGNYEEQPKYDGVHVQLYTGSAGFPPMAVSRQGERLPSLQAHADEAAAFFGWGVVLHGEAWHPSMEHRKINGEVRRRKQSENLGVWVYDIIAESADGGALASCPYRQRKAVINNNLTVYRVRGRRRSELLHAVDSIIYHEDCTPVFTKEQLYPEGAFDGNIVRNLSSPYKHGAAKNGEVIKVKNNLTLDLRVVASYAEQRPTKLGGYLTVDYNGIQSDVGSGLNQQQLGEIMQYEDRFVGSVAEIECLGITPDGKLREPRLKGFRHDTVREEDKE